MSAGRIASRYAKSLIQLAEEQKKLDRVLEDIESFRTLVKDSADFRNFIKSPIIQLAKKKAIWSKLFSGKYDDLTLKFLELLTQKQREVLLPEIAEEFVAQYKAKMQISTAVVTVANELSDANRKLIQEQIEKSGVAFSNVELTVQKDPSLIGGFILEMDNYIYDASVANQFNQLKKQFSS
ncbi:MAG: ATP synthase F1 subunit delta [Saprospiraceae bacterium]